MLSCIAHAEASTNANSSLRQHPFAKDKQKIGSLANTMCGTMPQIWAEAFRNTYGLLGLQGERDALKLRREGDLDFRGCVCR